MDPGASDEFAKTVAMLPRGADVERTLRPEELEQTAQDAQAQRSLPTVATTSDASSTGDFIITAKLAEGGMGEVFLAYQRSLRRQVALKRVKASDATASQALVEEARTAGGLEHPNVVPVHMLGTDEEGRALLVMKRIEGVSLEALAKNRAHPSWRELEHRYGDRTTAIIEVLCRVADALEFAHEHAVFHRDVKPENIMVGRHGEVYLLDWGVALDKSKIDPYAPRFIVGTPAYIAPELIAGDPTQVDARTDVFLLAATLHAVLTGTPRHRGATLHEALALAAACTPIEYGPEIDPELAAICNRGTARSPDDRPQDIASFRDELRRYLRQRGALSRVRRIEARLAEAGVTSERCPAPEVIKRRDVVALLGEARVVLDEAREEIGEHPALEQPRHALLLAQFELELARKDVDAAEAIAHEIKAQDPSLAPRLAALRSAIAEAEALARAARVERNESDPRHASAALGALTLAVFLIPMVVSWVGGTSARTAGARWLVAEIDLVVLCAMAVAIVLGRKRFLANRYGRSATLVIFAIVSSGTFADLLAAAQQRPPERAAPFTLAALAGPLVAGASFFGWPMAACGLLTGVCAAMCLVVPSIAPSIVAVVEFVTISTTIALLLRALRRPFEPTEAVAKEDSAVDAAAVSHETSPPP
jgi:serine/threonine-protein kinase